MSRQGRLASGQPVMKVLVVPCDVRPFFLRSRSRDAMVRLRRLRELLDFARTTTHFVRATTDGVRHIVADRLPSPRYVVRGVSDAVHDVNDASRDVLETLGRRVPKIGGRIGYALPKFQSQPRRKIDRKARPDRAA